MNLITKSGYPIPKDEELRILEAFSDIVSYWNKLGLNLNNLNTARNTMREGIRAYNIRSIKYRN